MVRHRNRLPRKFVNAPSLEVFKTRLDGSLSNLVQWKEIFFKAPLNPSHKRCDSLPHPTVGWVSSCVGLCCWLGLNYNSSHSIQRRGLFWWLSPWDLDSIRHRHWQYLGYCCYNSAVLPTALWLCCAFVCPLLSPSSPHLTDTHARILLWKDFILLTKSLTILKLISNCMICCPVIQHTVNWTFMFCWNPF